jgi:Leucine-rich repeat (LRR) protein
VAIGATDTTGCNSTTSSPPSLPQAPSTSTDNMELTLGATGRAATSSHFSIAARSLNCGAPTNRSTKCLGGAVDAVTLAAASAAQVDPDSLFSTSHMTALRSLEARLNGPRAVSIGLENLGDIFGDMETLNVRQNFQYLRELLYCIRNLGDIFGDMETLNVRQNFQYLRELLYCIRNLGDIFGDMETLNVRQNFRYLRELLYCISLLVSLRKLDVSYNSIVALPDFVGCLTKLQQLLLAGNGLNGTSPAQLAALSDFNSLSIFLWLCDTHRLHHHHGRSLGVGRNAK